MSASREPLHVLYLIDSLAGGGAERSLAALAPAYAARDLRLTVAYLHERPGVRADLEAAGAAVRSLEGPWGLAGAAARARRLVAATRPDLVHTTLFEADLVGRAAAGRVPVVTSLVNDAYGAAQADAPGLRRWKLGAARLLDAVSAQLGAPVPPPGIPGPFALDDPDRLARLLADAGLAEVVVTQVPAPLRDPSFDTWWTRTSALAGPLAMRLAALPEHARRQLRARLQVAVQPYQTPTGLDFPGVSLLAAGYRT